MYYIKDFKYGCILIYESLVFDVNKLDFIIYFYIFVK